VAAYFEATTKACGQAKLASNWIMGEVSRRLNASEWSIEQSPVSAAQLAALIAASATTPSATTRRVRCLRAVA
jgi:aspartyl-tRNA(Asn)/glutamyl-tRNA(Gln) amidotransferase subunit B